MSGKYLYRIAECDGDVVETEILPDGDLASDGLPLLPDLPNSGDSRTTPITINSGYLCGIALKTPSTFGHL